MGIIYDNEEYQKYNNSLCENFSKALYSKEELYSDKALSYLYGRGITDDIIKDFSIGWYPPNKNVKVLHNKFKSRIIFPIKDEFNDVIAFTGRAPLPKEKIPKKIPHWYHESFHKNYFLYGLNLAWIHILNKNEVFLVEGQLDVISMYKNGFKNTVGIMGSSLSEMGYVKLRRFTDNFCLILDNDKAGRSGAERAEKEIFIKKLGSDYRDNFTNIVLPEGVKDPDDFLSKNGREELLKIIKDQKNNNDNRKIK